MDFQHNNTGSRPQGGSQEQGQQTVPVVPIAAAPKKRNGWKMFLGVCLGLSVIANMFLFLMIIGLSVAFVSAQRGIFTEQVIQKGPSSSKIVVINLQGVITGTTAHEVYQQIKTAQEDQRVKGLIIRINSPGGTIFGSDGINNEISKYRQETGNPAVAFMQGVAASGGYYASVACDRIVAEPTVITGSVGVIMSHFVLQELFEDKLGIEPVVIKSGLRKDWPSLFSKVTDEQREYINEKLINPAYERFVQIVADGRPALSMEDVRPLADGSIYGAQEALELKMIDQIGYLNDAVKVLLALMGIEDAQVVEYQKQFSLRDFISIRSNNVLKLDKAAIYELTVPDVLYLCNMSGVR